MGSEEREERERAEDAEAGQGAQGYFLERGKTAVDMR